MPLRILIFICLVFVQQRIYAEQSVLSIVREARSAKQNGVEAVPIEVIKLQGANLSSAQVQLIDANNLTIDLPGTSWTFTKISNLKTHKVQKLSNKLRLVFLPDSASFSRCVNDKFDYGLLVVCKLVEQKKVLEEVIEKKQAQTTVPSSAKETKEAKEAKEVDTSIVNSKPLDLSLQSSRMSKSKNYNKPILTSVDFIGEGPSSQVKFSMSSNTKFDMAAISENLYRLALHDVVLEHEGLTLPYFAPQNFKGVNFIKITSRLQGIVVDLQMDSGAIPKVSQNAEGLIVRAGMR